MSKQFYQADVAESSSGSIWTGPVIYAESYAKAEFTTLLALQQDWGDEYMTEDFLEKFGAVGDDTDHEVRDTDPEFPGEEAWNAGDYWTDGCGGEVVMSMLTLSPVEALAQLGKIEFNVSDEDVTAVMDGRRRLIVAVIA